MKINNPFNYSGPHMEENNKPSLTIPEQTMTVRQLIERHVRGLPLDGAKIPIFNGEEDDMPDLRTLDLSEIANLKAENDAFLAEHQKKEAKALADKQKKEFDDLVEAKVQEKLKSVPPVKPEK